MLAADIGGFPVDGGLIILVIVIFFAWLCARLAAGKGYSPTLFAVLGFFFSCVTLTVIMLLPARNAPV